MGCVCLRSADERGLIGADKYQRAANPRRAAAAHTHLSTDDHAHINGPSAHAETIADVDADRCVDHVRRVAADPIGR